MSKDGHNAEPQEHPFPMVEPQVTVTPLPDAHLKEVLRLDAGSFFVPLEVGQEIMWSFYDWPERQLTNVSNTRVVGRVKYRRQVCLDVADIIVWGDDDGWWSRWLYRIENETLAVVLRETHKRNGVGEICEADVTPEPLRLRPGLKWQGHETYHSDGQDEGAGESHYGLVDGPFEVELPAGSMLCLRETYWVRDPSGTGRILAELYVAQSGRSVYFRRFNGPAWRNYGELASNPEREHEGVAWRLWYECLPEIALRPQAPPAG
jgi:hypothetical protein